MMLVAAAVLATAAGAASPRPAFSSHSIRLAGLPPLGLTARQAVDSCAVGQPAAVDRKPDADLSSERQVHVTYAIPADSPDQFSSFASKIATDAAAMDAWWRGQDPTRTIRFDLFAFPGCASKLGRLDLGFVRLPRAGSLYFGDAGADRLISDLGQLGALSSQKHLVYYDGPPVLDTRVCGTAFVPRTAPTTGGFAGIAFVWLRSLCGFDVGAGGLNAAVAVHELIHGLGALTQPGAPNECAAPDDGHVCDSTTDVLYPEATSQTRIATQTLDAGRDDYYGHSGGWFDVQDSGWLTRLPQLLLTIGFQNTGKAAGVVRMTSPSAFECAQRCSLELDSGTPVALVATPAAGSRFVGWRGACSGAGACAVAIDAAKSVTALFAVVVVRLTVNVTGGGKVTSTPAAVSCPTRCSATFRTGSTIRLKAKPSPGNRFVGWTGSCRGIGACVLKADRDRSARAIFRKRR
jgi:hypothetical protein